MPQPSKPAASAGATNRALSARRAWRLFAGLLPGLLLAACGGYFSDQWPNLAEGFEAWRFEAAPAEGAPAAVTSPPAPGEPAAPLTAADLERLGTDYDAFSTDLAAQVAAYGRARAALERGADRADEASFRRVWLDTQLELSRLGQLADRFREFEWALAPAAASPEDEPARIALAGRIQGERQDTAELIRREQAALAEIKPF